MIGDNVTSSQKMKKKKNIITRKHIEAGLCLKKHTINEEEPVEEDVTERITEKIAPRRILFTAAEGPKNKK